MSGEYDLLIIGRDGRVINLPSSVAVSVNRYSFADVGGPRAAQFTLSGAAIDLWSSVQMLGASVTISGPHGRPVWWGRVQDVLLNINRLQLGWSLTGMANRVWVAYQRITAGSSGPGTRVTTGTFINPDSVLEYGQFELMASAGSTNDVAAASIAQQTLAQRGHPIKSLSLSGQKGEIFAQINCVGWWETLAQRYYANPAGYIGITSGTTPQNFGEGSGITRLAQRFQISSVDWEASTISVRLRRVGSPADAVRIALWSDAAGVPLAELGGANVSGLSTSSRWVTVTLPTPVPLSSGAVNYWVVLSRTGANDATHHYVTDVDMGNPSITLMRWWNGSVWQAFAPDRDMTFQVGGVQENTVQIAQMVQSAGQYGLEITFDRTTAITSSQFRDGDRLAKHLIEDLLSQGASNERRFLARVDQFRKIWVYEQPRSTDEDWSMDTEGNLWQGSARHETWRCPAGYWVRIKNIGPALSMFDNELGWDRVYISEAEYRPGQAEYIPVAASRIGPSAIVQRLITG